MPYLSAKRSRSLFWWEETPCERRFGKPFTGPIIPFGSLVEYHPKTAIGKKVLPGLFLGYALYAGRIWKGDKMVVADIEKLETMDASEIYLQRLNAKEVLFPQKLENSFFQSQMDEQKNLLEETRNWEHPPWYGTTHFEEKVKEVFLENLKGLHLHHLKTHIRMPVKQEMIFAPCQETSYTAITLNPGSNFTRREKNHSLFHWNTLTSPELHTQIWMLSKSRIDDNWNIDGSRDLSDPWTGFTQFALLEEKAPDGFLWSGWRLTRKQLTSRPDHLWPELWTKLGRNAKLKEKQKWSNEKLHLENARKLRGIYFIDPEDTEFKETIKNARKKSETSVAPAMPCKILKNCGSGASNKIKTKLACILEASESTRLRMGESLPNHHEDHIAGKGENSLQHFILVTSLFLCLKLWKNPSAKEAVDKEREKWRNFRRGTWRKSEARKRWSMKQGRRAQKLVHFASLMDMCHLNNAELETKAPEIQRSSCTPVWYCERRFRFLRSIHWTRFISVTNDSSKSHGYYLQIAGLRWTSSRRSIC